MRPEKPGTLDKDDLDEVQNEVRYMEPNRDRTVGDADRTGRHFDGEPDEGTEASEEHEAD